MRISCVVAALCGLVPLLQDPAPRPATPAPAAPAAPAAPTAAAADVASPEALMQALYESISGAAGVKRDWQRVRSLFHPDARMAPMLVGKNGASARLLTVEDYVQRAGPNLERDGFFEQEITRRLEVFGDTAHAWSTYEGRRTRDDGKPFLRGINSVQMVRQGGRWCVLSILWQQESDAVPIPPAYLPAK